MALACAEEALEVDPRDRAPLRERAIALAALDRDADARAALSRLLAADPDDPATLLVAADLHVTRFGDRDSLEAGLDLALRGAARAVSGPRSDPSLAPRLLVLAGMAENDLGHNREALLHLEEAVARNPRDVDAQYERGVALFELCRFASARRAFERVLRQAPRDPWALHHLGLLAERAGDERRARELLGRAARIAPRDLRPPVELSRVGLRGRAPPGPRRAARVRAGGARRGAGRGRGDPGLRRPDGGGAAALAVDPGALPRARRWASPARPTRRPPAAPSCSTGGTCSASRATARSSPSRCGSR